MTIDVIPTTAALLANRAAVISSEIDPEVVNNAVVTTTTVVEPPIETLPEAAAAPCAALRVACNQAESLGNNCGNRVTLAQAAG